MTKSVRNPRALVPRHMCVTALHVVSGGFGRVLLSKLTLRTAPLPISVYLADHLATCRARVLGHFARILLE